MIDHYEDAVNYINDIPKFTSKTSLDHTRHLLAKLGNPERDLKIIHVAGTNGKGSVCAYLNSMLSEGGKTCGLFTSPHLVRINERYMIGGVPVEDALFLKAFQRVMEAVEETKKEGETHPTYFETLFLMGMLIFRAKKVDYVILETGLGGRLDATNVVERPLASIIVSISRDHTEYLGETIPEIAKEKAGIIKPGIPIIYDGRNPQAASVIKERADKLGSPAFALTDDMVRQIEKTREGIRFAFRCENGSEAALSVPYIADYQMMNASLAFFTMQMLKKEHHIEDETLVRGIRKTKWPCRMETVLPGVIIDGAHNEDGVAQFVKTAAYFRKEGEITVLFSAVSDKRYPDMIREIAEGIRPERVITTQISGYREVPAETLAQLFKENGCETVLSEKSIGKAFELAYSLKGDGMLFCVGSLYLAGELKNWISARAL